MSRRLPLYEPPIVIPQSDGSLMLREGYCNRCGVCCVTGNPVPELGPGPVPNACHFFEWEEEPTETSQGIGTCRDLTNYYRLRGCNVWPQKPEQAALYPTCGYTFKPFVAYAPESSKPPAAE